MTLKAFFKLLGESQRAKGAECSVKAAQGTGERAVGGREEERKGRVRLNAGWERCVGGLRGRTATLQEGSSSTDPEWLMCVGICSEAKHKAPPPHGMACCDVLLQREEAKTSLLGVPS